MAGIACQSDDGNNAVFVGTFLESGDSVTVCRDCLQAWSTALAQELTGAPIIDFLREYVPTEISADDNAAALVQQGEFLLWAEANKESITAFIETGLTFEEAVEQVRALEGLKQPDEASSPASSN